jgi:RNA polymerase sigma factor (sigma-70 family)
MKPSTASYEDQALLQALREGRPDIIDTFRSRYFPMVLDMVLKYRGHAEQAEDIFEEGLVALWEYSRSPDFELRSRLGTLFYGICRNLYLKFLRKNARIDLVRNDAFTELMDEQANVETALIARERMQLFTEAFARLGEDCRKLLTLAVLEERKADELMTLMQFSSLNYLYKRKSQCKEYLIKLFRQQPHRS